jgi:hypothetical protein
MKIIVFINFVLLMAITDVRSNTDKEKMCVLVTHHPRYLQREHHAALRLKVVFF